MNQITEYSWWGTINEPPPHLKTRKQLARMGLKPKNPVGVIHTNEYDCYLYDSKNINSAAPKRKCSPSQQQNLCKARDKAKKQREWKRWEKYDSPFEIDRTDAVKWARGILKSSDKYIILDTETTGLDDARIVEIAIIDIYSNQILNTLVNPLSPIPQEAIAIHGIDDAAVEHSPTFPAIYQQVADVIKNKTVLVYNLSFDSKVLKSCCELHQLPVFKLNRQGDCVMHWYSQWVGDYSNYWGDYRWQPLNGGHRAIDDCLATLQVIKQMAEDSPEIAYPPGYPDKRKNNIFLVGTD